MHIWYYSKLCPEKYIRTLLKIFVQELQLNILQQTHLMQAGEKVKSSVLLQQLQTKQQQLMGQLQQAQHLLTLNMLIQVTTELSQRNFTKFSHCSEK